MSNIEWGRAISKINLSNVVTGYISTEALTANFDAVEEAFDNTLSRDGSTPNDMKANLDLGANRIINVGEPVDPTDAIRLTDVDAIVDDKIAAQVSDLGALVSAEGVADIEAARDDAIDAITSAVPDLTAVVDEAIADVEIARDDALSTIDTAEAGALDAIADASADVSTDLATAASALVFDTKTNALAALSEGGYGYVQSAYGAGARKIKEVSAVAKDQGDFLPMGNVGLSALTARVAEGSLTPWPALPDWYHNAADGAIETDGTTLPNRISTTRPTENIFGAFGWGALKFQSFGGTLTQNHSLSGGTVAIQSGGTGYTVGGTLTVSGGTGTAATLTISSVSGGAVTGVTIASNGSYTAWPANPVSVTGGSGSGATFNLTPGPDARWTASTGDVLRITNLADYDWPAGDYSPVWRVQSYPGGGTVTLRYGMASGYKTKSVGEGAVVSLDETFTYSGSSTMDIAAPSGSGCDIIIKDLALWHSDVTTPVQHAGASEFNYHLRPAWAHRGGFKRTGVAIDNSDATQNTGGGVIQFPEWPNRTTVNSLSFLIVHKLPARPSGNAILFANNYDPSNPAGSTAPDRMQLRLDSTGSHALLSNGAVNPSEGPQTTVWDMSGQGWVVSLFRMAATDKRLDVQGIPYFTAPSADYAPTFTALAMRSARLLSASSSQDRAMITSSEYLGQVFLTVGWVNKFLTDEEAVLAFEAARDRLTSYGMSLTKPEVIFNAEGDSIDAWLARVGGSYPQRIYQDTTTSEHFYIRVMAEGGSNILDSEERERTLMPPFFEAAARLGSRVVIFLPASLNNVGGGVPATVSGNPLALYAQMVRLKDRYKRLGRLYGVQTYVIAITCMPRADGLGWDGTGSPNAWETGRVTLNAAITANTGNFDDVIDLSSTVIGDPLEPNLSLYRDSGKLHLTSDGQAVRTLAFKEKMELFQHTTTLPLDGNPVVDENSKGAQIFIGDPTGTVLSTGDGKGWYIVPEIFDGWSLVGVQADVTTASSSGVPTFQIHNTRTGVDADMLSLPLTIDATEKTSLTASSLAIINPVVAEVAAGDQLRIDCDVAGTGTKGAAITLTFGRI